MKKKILMLALAVCLITLSIAGASLAYFTDVDEKTSVFTSGNVDIALSYNDAQLKVYPGQTYTEKAATIENTGSEKAFVGAIIEVELPAGDNYTPLTINQVAGVFTGLGTYKYEETANGYKIYVVLGELDTTDGNNTTSVFSAVSIPKDWDHAEMASFKDMTIKVTGYAVQTVGLEENGAASALVEAFGNAGGAWENYSTATDSN